MSVLRPITVPLTVTSNGQTVPMTVNESIQAEMTYDYDLLENKPQINGVELTGNISSDALGVMSLPEDGSVGDLLSKTGGDTYGWVTPATSAQADNTRPITSAAVFMEIGNINALLATI